MTHSEILLLAAAVSLDSAAAGAALGVSRIKIPLLSAVLISGIGALSVLIPAVFGDILTQIVPAVICGCVSRLILAALGIVSVIRSVTAGRNTAAGADKNRDRRLGISEAAALAAGLSADSAVTGFSAGLTDTDAKSCLLMVICVFASGFAAVEAGAFIGKKVSFPAGFNTDLISGLLLILLAFVV